MKHNTPTSFKFSGAVLLIILFSLAQGCTRRRADSMEFQPFSTGQSTLTTQNSGRIVLDEVNVVSEERSDDNRTVFGDYTPEDLGYQVSETNSHCFEYPTPPDCYNAYGYQNPTSLFALADHFRNNPFPMAAPKGVSGVQPYNEAFFVFDTPWAPSSAPYALILAPATSHCTQLALEIVLMVGGTEFQLNCSSTPGNTCASSGSHLFRLPRREAALNYVDLSQIPAASTLIENNSGMIIRAKANIGSVAQGDTCANIPLEGWAAMVSLLPPPLTSCAGITC